MSHQLGGRQMYLPIQIPIANASAAHSRGSRPGRSILDVEPGRIRLLKRVKCPALRDVWATVVVDPPEGKVDAAGRKLEGQTKNAFNVKRLRKKID